MHDCSLVDTATNEVDQNCDEHDDTEDTAWTKGLFLDVHATAGGRRAPLEEVDAVVDSGDEGECGLGKRVGFAEKGDDGCLAALAIFRGLFLVGIIVTLVLILILVFVFVLVLVIVVVVIIDEGSGGKLDSFMRCTAARGRRRAERAAGVVQDELATAKDRLVALQADASLVSTARGLYSSWRTHPRAYCLLPIS